VATLEYAESLISTKTDAPTVIVNGNVVVTTGAATFDAAQLARVNLVTGKMATVLKDLTVSNTATPVVATIDFGALTFVDQSVYLTGTTSTPKLKTITSDLSVNAEGAVDYSGLTNIGRDVEIYGAEVTSLNLNGVTIGGTIQTNGSASSTIVLPKATTIDVGTASVISLTATLGTDIDLGNATALASLSVTAPVATQIDILATSVAGALVIGTGTPTLVFANSITAAGATTVNAVAQFHATSLVETLGASTIAAEVVNLPVWAGTTTATMAMAGAHTTGLNLPAATLAANEFTAAAAKIITVKSTTEALLTAPAIENLTILALGDETDFNTDAGFATLKTLNITGAADASPSDSTQRNDITVDADAAALTDLTVGGTVHSVTGNLAPVLKNVTLTGAIGDITMSTLVKLESLAIGTSHIEGASASTLVVVANPILTSVAPTAMSEVKTIAITLNPKLTTIDFSALTVIPTGSVTGAITVNKNALSGAYDYAVAATETTGYIDTVIKQDDLLSFKPYTVSMAASHTLAMAFDIDAVTVGAATSAVSLTAAFLKDGAIGNGDQTPAASTTVTGTTFTTTINTAAELAIVDAE
jgi:hypothetical protein